MYITVAKNISPIAIILFIVKLLLFLFKIYFSCFSCFCVFFTGSASVSLLRSPRRSSSLVTQKISAITGIRVRSGAVSSRSHRLTDLSDTCSLSASSFCVIPFAFRSVAIKLPMVFFSIYSILHLSKIFCSILQKRQKKDHIRT